MWYQTTLSQCFPFYFNQNVPAYEHRECQGHTTRRTFP